MEKAPINQALLLREQNLYGARLFLNAEYSTEAVEAYVEVQEITHLAEGSELQQRTPRQLEYIDGHVRGFGGQTMVEVNRIGYLDAKRRYLEGDKAAWYLMRRREHDCTISECYDSLMANGQVGDVILAASPYQEELDDKTAGRLGFYPEYRRSYAWFYRKKSEHELECIDVSIDQSNLATYKKLLGEYGAKIPEEVQSHDLPSYLVQLHADSEEERDQLVDEVIGRYKTLNTDPQALSGTDGFESVTFLKENAGHYVRLLVDLHRSIAESLATGDLHDVVRIGAVQALNKLDCLDQEQISSLQYLLTDSQITAEHSFALSTLVAAQRYGIWQAVSETIAKGPTRQPLYVVGDNPSAQTLGLLNEIYGHTNQAAAEFKTQPGCPGGVSFLRQDEQEVKSSIFSNEKYSFNQKMYCVVCQAPPKENEQPKWCGPCGLCRNCDHKLQTKPATAA